MTFDPKPHLIRIGKGEYLPVPFRIVWFRATHPNGTIHTEIQSLGDVACVHATIRVEDNTLSTGMATIRAAGQKEQTWAGREIEKAETAAIGRALGHAGFGTQFMSEDETEGSYLSDSPVQNKNGQKQNLNIAELRSASRFMFADDESHKTMVDMLLASETIKGDSSLDGAMSHVLIAQASAKFEYSMEDILKAIGADGKYSEWLKEDDHTHEKAWALIVADYEKQQAETEPATAKTGEDNPFIETQKAKKASKAQSSRKKKPDMNAVPEDEPEAPGPK